MALPKKRCGKTLDLFAGTGTTCGQSYSDLVASERERLRRTPTHDLQNMGLALSLHRWSDTPEEYARATAVMSILAERSLPRMMLSTPKSRIERIQGTNLIRIKRRP